MLFKVTKPLSGKDTSTVPETLVPFEPLNPTYATRERLLLVSEKERPSDGYVIIGLLGQRALARTYHRRPKGRQY